ncbi:tail fiber assembly protein [Cedecea neteri]|uniref:tail fiber assembly protein n=1 Tax=Cedecea neteri TaxID=158822 RepID=UPI002893495E|nr:tail fiber assembly protein [Cedecea neteri]WNJ80620.1 tail fiber assembly protein [Cedecea neteri]
MKYLYSPKNNIFYPADDLGVYEAAASLPSDLVEVTDEVFDEYSVFTNGDKVRVAGQDGYPAWGDRPQLSAESATIIKNTLMREANDSITPLQDAVDLDIATDEEKTSLLAWKKYRVLLMRIDTSKPKNISWPDRPL